MNAITEAQTTKTVAYDVAPAIMFGRQAQAMHESATSLTIDSDAMLDLAAEDLRRVKGLQKDVEAKRTSIVGPLNQAVKAINDMFRGPTDYLAKAESTLKLAITNYQREAERKALEAQREAERQAEEQRKLLEAQRLEAEQAAAVAAEVGDTQAAQDLAIQAATAEALQHVVTVVPAYTAPKAVSGLASRKTYKVDSIDLMTLVKAVAEGKAPIECLQANESFLGTQARAFKKTGELFPGVVVVENSSIAARAS